MVYYPNLKQIIGKGTCGNIYMSQEKPGKIVLKEIDKEYILLYTEYFIKLTQGSDYLLSLYDIYPINDIYYITMEYLNGEDLLDYVIRKRGLSDPINKKDKKDKLSKRSNKHVKMILRDILYGIEYLHKNMVIHCDIKLENIRILDNGKIKLFDYHLSTYIDSPNKRFRGSNGYIAPEMFFNSEYNNDYYNEKVDIWSLGICLSIMMECKMILTTNYSKYTTYLRKYYVMNDISHLLNKNIWDKPLLEIFKSMTNFKPKYRKSSFELIQMLDGHLNI